MCCNMPYTHVGKLFLQAASSLPDAVRAGVAESYSQCNVGLNHSAGTYLTSFISTVKLGDWIKKSVFIFH